ncbi:MAG: amidase family protein [Bryobacteraceae bacterium]
MEDAALLLDVIAGYDPNDRLTAYSSSEDYKRGRVVTDQAIRSLQLLGAELVDPFTIPELKERASKAYETNVFETEEATDTYLAQHANAPVKSLSEIMNSGKVVPARARTLKASHGRSTKALGYLELLQRNEETRQLVLSLMADHRVDALVYATFDMPPALVAPDALTNPNVDLQGLGNNRRLAPTLGFPALTVPAGFTPDGLPVGIEFLGRAFSEATLLKLGYAYERKGLTTASHRSWKLNSETVTNQKSRTKHVLRGCGWQCRATEVPVETLVSAANRRQGRERQIGDRGKYRTCFNLAQHDVPICWISWPHVLMSLATEIN